MASKFTEHLIDQIRNGGDPISVQGRAMLDLADERDELVAACQAVQAAFYSSGIDSIRVVKLAEAMELVDAALEKATQHAAPPTADWDPSF